MAAEKLTSMAAYLAINGRLPKRRRRCRLRLPIDEATPGHVFVGFSMAFDLPRLRVQL